MKRIVRVALSSLALMGVVLLSAGCGLGQREAQDQETETTTVQRGDLQIEVTSVGNLELSQTENLAFDMAGTVEEVLIDEGDSVTKGQELVKLDTSERDDLIKTRERALATAQRAFSTAERLIGAKELAVRQEEVDLATAEYNLTQIDEVKAAQDKVDQAELNLKLAKAMLSLETGSSSLLERVEYEEDALAKAQRDLQEILSGSSVSLTTSAALLVQKYNLLVEQAQRALEDSQIALENARLDLEDAEEDVDDAQANLDEAKAFSPIIKAPFDGFITRVNVEGGDEVLRGTVAVQLADPDKFEADILVGEMDILQVELGGTALVEVDALSGLTLPAKVTHISPTASIQAGVVNYSVKVEITSFEAIAEERQDARQQLIDELSSGEMPELMKQAIAEGRMTQEQAELFMERMRSGEFPTAGRDFGQGLFPGIGGGGQMTTSIPDNFQLREGLTVTVNIIVDSRINVLLIPNAAISTRGGQSTVQVVADDGSMEERTIEVGITDYQFTEVVSGLTEGETITVPKGTSTTSTTQQNRQGGFFMGGMGRP